MGVDVGGGTSEVAVISLGGIVESESVRTGGYEMDEAIAAYIRHEHRMAIGAQTAEDIKFEIGSAAPLAEELVTETRGRALTTGWRRGFVLSSETIRVGLAEPVQTIIDAIKNTLE